MITCILCRISLSLTSFTAMDFNAKLTVQLDFDHAAMLAYMSAELRTWTSDTTICEAILA